MEAKRKKRNKHQCWWTVRGIRTQIRLRVYKYPDPSLNYGYYVFERDLNEDLGQFRSNNLRILNRISVLSFFIPLCVFFYSWFFLARALFLYNIAICVISEYCDNKFWCPYCIKWVLIEIMINWAPKIARVSNQLALEIKSIKILCHQNYHSDHFIYI